MKELIEDKALPAIRTVLDVDAMLDLLQTRLPECRDAFELNDLKIIDVQYKPRVFCKALYRLKARNRETKRSATQMFSSSVIRSGETPAVIAPELFARYKVDRSTILRTPAIYFPDLQASLFAFPIDPALPWLIETLDGGTLKKHLRRNWAWRSTRIIKVHIEPIGYTPQARAALFCELLEESRDSKEPQMRSLIGKMHAYRPAAFLFSGAWALWQTVNHKIRIAPPVAYISPLRLTFQEKVRGERLTEFADDGSFVGPVKKTARAIAHVHKLELPLTSTRSPEKEAAVSQRWKEILIAICPEQTERIERLSNQIAAELISRTLVEGPVHGDFHPANVMWDGSEITLVDLDDLSYGDPLVDVGRFLASLRVSALRISDNVSALSNVQEAFLQHYLQHSRSEEQRARLFEASSLLIAACAPFRLQRPGWKQAAVLMLDEAERIWNNSRLHSFAGAAPSVMETDSENATPDAVKWVKDPVYMRTVLDPHVQRLYGAELVECRIRATESGDEPKLTYQLYGWKGTKVWRSRLSGMLWQERGGLAVVKRLEALALAVAHSPHAPVLPVPVTYMRHLGLIVWVPPSGTSLSKLMLEADTEALRAAATKAARALAVLHSSNLPMDLERTAEDELRLLRNEVRQLHSVLPAAFQRATALLETVEHRFKSLEWQSAPVLRKLHPNDILFNEDRVAFAMLQKLSRSHPFIDAADFLARILLIGTSKNMIRESTVIVDSFRTSYLEEVNKSAAELAVFEVIALLGLACRQAALAAEGNTVDALLDFASRRLVAGS